MFIVLLQIGFLSFLIYIITLSFGIVYLIRMKRNRDCYIPLKKRRLYISLLVILPGMIAAALAMFLFFISLDTSSDGAVFSIKFALFLTTTLFVNLVNLPLILALVVLPCSRERERAEKLLEERRNEIPADTSGAV